MSAKMMQFVSLEQKMPEKRTADVRTSDFDEIYGDYSTTGAEAQSSRCEQCGVPFCQVHCPLQNNIPDWLRMTAEGRLREAWEISSSTNSFPEICGRICPQDRLCEGNCVIEQGGHGTVTIGAVERYITDTAFENGWVEPIRPRREREQSVGIVGAGPAGLAAAEQLRREGYAVTVYDRYDRVGGLLIYGIPGFKLEKDIVQRRSTWLVESGVQFVMNTDVGRDITLEELREKHDAVFLGNGVYKARDLKAPGSGLDGIIPALDYLTASNRRGLGDEVANFSNGLLNASERDVVVIGGGDTAMDCVRTATRQGARSVTCLYRRDKENMPGSMREVTNAEEEGVHFAWLSAPEAFLGDGQVDAVRAVEMRLGMPDATGRRSPVPVANSAHRMEAQMVIKALGFDPEDLPTHFNCPALNVTGWGTVKIDWETMQTSIDGIFAGGDIVRGASLVVWAIKDGRDAASSIHRYLQDAAATEKATQSAA